MRIERLEREECYAILARNGFGRLACAKGGQPYVVPVYFVVGNECLYSFALPGQKIDWMRENPRVCLETDSVVGANDWTSVVVYGHYHELPNDPEFQRERAIAHELLRRRPMWWEPGAVSIDDDRAAGYGPIFYRVRVDTISGQRAVPALDESALPYVAP